MPLPPAWQRHHAQQDDPQRQALNSDNKYWEGQFPTGTYMVRLSAISSVSKHQYIVDGAAKVTESQHRHLGSEQARFYYIEPNTPKAGRHRPERDQRRPGSGAGGYSARPGSDRGRTGGGKKLPHDDARPHGGIPCHEPGYSRKIFTSVRNALLDNRGITFKP